VLIESISIWFKIREERISSLQCVFGSSGKWALLQDEDLISMLQCTGKLYQYDRGENIRWDNPLTLGLCWNKKKKLHGENIGRLSDNKKVQSRDLEL